MSAPMLIFESLYAEIERLKAENARLKQWNLMTDEQLVMDLKAEIKDQMALIEENNYQKQLITELCDALEKWADWNTFNPGEINRLIQRAREAAR
jgi:hypothetical protein